MYTRSHRVRPHCPGLFHCRSAQYPQPAGAGYFLKSTLLNILRTLRVRFCFFFLWKTLYYEQNSVATPCPLLYLVVFVQDKNSD